MISQEALLKQLEKINFNPNGWGRSEVRELRDILLPDEEIDEVVNGYYEAGFALLVATNHRVLLVDKKPLNYLTVEDIRFDMISEFDYSHRLIGAHVSISSGNKTLSFTSLNQERLRRLLTYVQTRMTEMKTTAHQQRENQQQHLQEMNSQLNQYLAATSQQVVANEVAKQLAQAGPVYSNQSGYTLPEPVPLYDIASFERAAEQSIAEVAPPTTADTGVSHQQVGLGAVRRVVPIANTYARDQARRAAYAADVV